MDHIPLKMPVLQEVREDVGVTVPDYLTILLETEYEFSLENCVLTGLQSGFTRQDWPQLSSSSSGLPPSCPPYWMMFSSPQQSCLASRHSSDFWEPNPQQRSCTKFTITGKGEGCAYKALHKYPPVSYQQVQQKTFVPVHFIPPACQSTLPHQCRKNLQQDSLSVPETSAQHDVNAPSQDQNVSSYRPSGTGSPTTRDNAVYWLSRTTNHKTKHMIFLSPDLCRNPPVTPAHQGLPFSGSDSSAELLSALSPEERELLGAITARGYPLHTAIIALQKMGRQAPDQILSYMVACDHLCRLGYDMAEVEEALEMFQNCETKAEEFLHLLSEFHEMGFQQSAIKEVLLVHENHRERALEELMMRVV